MLTIGLTVAFAMLGGGRASAASTTCNPATSAAAHALCWLDLTPYTTGTGTMAFTWAVPDGSVLTATVSSTAATPAGLPTTLPTYVQAYLGNTLNGFSYYLGLTKAVAIYGPGADNNAPLYLQNLQLTDPTGKAVPSFAMAGADAETTDSGDHYLEWNASAGTWSVLQLMGPTQTIANTCALVVTGTTAICTASTGGAPANAYILTNTVASGGTIGMQYNTTAGAKEGYAFAIELAQVTLNKTITARVAASDQFTVETFSPGKSTPAFTGSTTGTGTTATTGPGIVVPGDTYTLTEVASNNDLASYTTTISCTNAVSSSTTLPSGVGTSFTITPALDDQITCTFTNVPRATVAKTVTNVTNPNGTTTINTGKPGDDLQYGLTFTNATGVALTGTTAKPITITDTVPANTTFSKYACTTPQNGFTCAVTAPAVGSTGTTITFTFTGGTLAAGASLSGTFDVLIM